MLTGAWVRLERGAGSLASSPCGGAGAVLAEEGAAEGVRAPGLHRSTCGAPVKPVGGSEGPEGRRRRAIERWSYSPASVPGANSAHTRAGVREEGSGEVLGPTAKLLRRFVVVDERRSSGSAAARRPLLQLRECGWHWARV